MIAIDAASAVGAANINRTSNPKIERTEMKLRIRKRNPLAGTCSVLLVLCAGQLGLAQQRPSTPVAHTVNSSTSNTTAQQPAEEEKEAASARAGSDGIKIHGHWKFVVHNPDGKLVSTREFENSLVTPGEGDFTLAFVLSGYAVSADWAIVLCPQAGSFLTNNGTGFTKNVVCTTGGPTPIAVLLPSPTGPLGSILAQASLCGSGCVGGLQEQVNNNLSGTTTPLTFSLIGSYTASQSVTINAVETLNAICGEFNSPLSFSNISPLTCSTLNAGNIQSSNSFLALQQFTGTNLNTAQTPSQSLTTGQVLTVTVTIGFS